MEESSISGRIQRLLSCSRLCYLLHFVNHNRLIGMKIISGPGPGPALFNYPRHLDQGIITPVPFLPYSVSPSPISSQKKVNLRIQGRHESQRLKGEGEEWMDSEFMIHSSYPAN